MSSQGLAGYDIPQYSISGWIISYASTTTLSITAGQARDSNGYMDIITGGQPTNAPFTVAPTTVTATINGVNGLDTGTFAAGGQYYIFAIGSSLGNAPCGFLLSLSGTAPTLPANYDSLRLIGEVQSGATAVFRPFTMVRSGSTASFQYLTQIIMAAGTSATSATTNLVEVTSGYVAVPTVGLYKVNLNIAYTPTTAGNVLSVKGYDGAAVTTANTQYNFAGIVSGGVQDEAISLIVGLNSGVPAITYLIGTAGTQTTHVIGYDMAL